MANSEHGKSLSENKSKNKETGQYLNSIPNPATAGSKSRQWYNRHQSWQNVFSETNLRFKCYHVGCKLMLKPQWEDP